MFSINSFKPGWVRAVFKIFSCVRSRSGCTFYYIFYWTGLGQYTYIYIYLYMSSHAWAKLLIFILGLSGQIFISTSWTWKFHPVQNSIISCNKTIQNTLFVYSFFINEWQLFFVLCHWQVLIIGGGVGGTLREVSKHPLVESIAVCEIDQVWPQNGL